MAARRTPRRLDEYRPGMDSRDIQREAEQRDRRYDEMDSIRDRIIDDYVREDRDETMRRVINDPAIIIQPDMLEIINDPSIEVDRQMKPVRVAPARTMAPLTIPARNRGSSSSPFASQFRFDKIAPALGKRTRKKTTTDKKMSKALKMANKKLRNKNGKLKKGKTMRDVMKMAHKLRKK